MKGKGIVRCQVRVKKANKRELSVEASKVLYDVKTREQYRLWDKQQGHLITIAAASGV